MMKIKMVVLDWQCADLTLRENFAFSKEEIPLLCRQALGYDGVLGAVLLATCNRTELCLSLTEDASIQPEEVLADLAGDSLPEGSFRRYEQYDCLEHLFYLCCGMESRIWGDDQILTQVKQALADSAEAGCCDGVLQTLYRIAITGGKRVKTELSLQLGTTGAAEEAASELQKRLPVGSAVLVIGNGQMGRRAAELLIQAGYAVTMTLRRYKHSENRIPSGCRVIPYDQRYEALSGFDGLISATTSPHCTIVSEKVQGKLPEVLIDLAVPRDIEPGIAGVLTIDQLGAARDAQMAALRQEAAPFYEKAKGDFLRWEARRGRSDKPGRFPLFIDLENRKVLVVGGGKVALRRIKALVQFSCRVEVVALEAADAVKELALQGAISCKERGFLPSDLSNAAMVIAATNDRAVNRQIGVLCRERGIPVSVADCKEECSFYFPAIVMEEDAVIGVCGDGGDHAAVARAAAQLRESTFVS